MEDIYGAYRYELPFSPELISRAPGRINLIGEHTDYNDGLVMPAAIEQSISVALRSNGRPEHCRFWALDLDETYECSFSTMQPLDKGWPNYIMGVISELRKLGAHFGGFDLAFGGNIPIGAGMSSSAALESAVALALNQYFKLGFDRSRLIKVAQMAEHHYAGTRCGIMDMFASVRGQENQVIRLDCRSLDYTYFPLDMGDYTLLLLNTNVSHSLAESAYNDRRSACETGVQLVQRHFPEVKALRDVALDMLAAADLPAEINQRCSFVVEENQRVVAAGEALEAGDLQKLGQYLYASHAGLRHEYEVSCSELDFLVDFVRDRDGVLGARMMGGGFGGCTLNLIHQDIAPDLIEAVRAPYRQAFGREPTPIMVRPGAGAGIVFPD